MKRKEVVEELKKALDPTNNFIGYYNPLTSEISEVKTNNNWIKIEPLSEEILSCISDFIYETEDEFLEKEMEDVIKSRTPLISFMNYLIGKKTLTKNWNSWKDEWLDEQASDFLEDVED